MKKLLITYKLLLLVGCLTATTVHAQINAHNLRCEMLLHPKGIDVLQPRLSWEITGPFRNIQQTAYQVLVASSPVLLMRQEGDLWNSGKVPSGQSIHIPYKGKPLTSRTTCYWMVKVWTNKGESRWIGQIGRAHV